MTQRHPIMTSPLPSAATLLVLRQAIAAHYLADESAVLRVLADAARLPEAAQARSMATARQLVSAVREKLAAHRGMQSFMHQYDLSSQEGILLMCVAEALLRIPDPSTADKLIRDKFAQGDWARHLGQSRSLLVNAGTWGMLLTGKITQMEPEALPNVGGWLAGLAQKTSEPVVRAALRQGMRMMAEQFVMGRTIEDALARAASPDYRPYRYSYDMLGEAALTAADAARYYASYERAIEEIGGAVQSDDVFAAPSISVKLSALHPRYEFAKAERIMSELVPKVRNLALFAKSRRIGFCIDAEESDRLDLSLDLIEAVYRTPALAQWDGFGLAVQAYQKRAPFVIDWLTALIRDVSAQEGRPRRMMVRLVKGAYWDTEIKRAQVGGHTGYPVFTRKAATDVSYLACAARMLAASDVMYSMFATHNAHTAAHIATLAAERALDRRHFEFQRLHGMGEEMHGELIAKYALASRVYAPVGSHEDLLPYLVRRLLENGANTSFVNRIADQSVPLDQVVTDPIAHIEALQYQPNSKLPMPAQLFGDRANSFGFTFADTETARPILAAMEPGLQKSDWFAAPIVGGTDLDGLSTAVVDPARNLAIGTVHEAGLAAVADAYDIAARYVAPDAQARALILEACADKLEADLPTLLALAAREAGKTLPDGIGEVREAVDFCRYYATQCRATFAHPVTLPGPTGESNTLSMAARGTFICISPWNFPLAIFVGQVAAAFAAGNSVIAKPAEQTALMAYRAVRLMLAAGVPKEALALLPGRGETIGAALVEHPQCAGVAFTGSTDVARIIHRTLANKAGPIVPLIAETGGQNAMIVDSSALPEQVVNDAVASAFNSAGQRCSALRVLYVQEDCAERVIQLLKGAVAELTLGDPADLKTDVGPVIDAEAKANLDNHIRDLSAFAKPVCQAEMPATLTGTFFPPMAFEIDSIQQLKREVFGPVLHIIRFPADGLASVVADINATGFGLTLGIHSRVESNIEFVRARAKVGNLYVNRNQIGAVVGVQPFGGEGLSGTGPKAGGPHYLARFATERVVTVNTAAAGGNAQLIATAE
jgi:RHH-type transcriptional regulator, proline utilization regulon repressor / proline dehydrogenase / delta 1-pyrroline-5-carboxylate dehydrogenase